MGTRGVGGWGGGGQRRGDKSEWEQGVLGGGGVEKGR